ncbi:MAG: HlyC/CorC family transporter [Anaerolineae bacterium]|nr:HlyC/CorC family transporter [Anaerolineae bacterium]
MDDSLTGLAVLGGIILLNALLKMAYIAIIHANKAALKELADDGDDRANRALKLANEATRMLASQQVLDLILRFAIAIVAALTLVPPIRDGLLDQGASAVLADGLAYGGVMLVVAIITLVFGEMLPSNIALNIADALAIRVVGLINVLSHILAPVLQLLQWISGQFAAPFVGRGNVALVTEAEIKMMVDAGSEGGSIEDEEKEMIYSIFQLGDTLVREVMVPRIDIVALEIDTPFDEALNTIVEAGHSRIPVYAESIDHIRGLLYAKDLLAAWRDGAPKRPIKDMLREAYFVPESKKADDLLADLQQQKVHLAVVVDEYGGTAGLVTLEDLIEEIVGEIRDEYDFNEEEAYQQISDNEWLFDAGIDLDDLNHLLETHLPTDESDTLGGYIYSKLGKVPAVGETIETAKLLLEVTQVDDRRIRKIRLTRLHHDEDEEPLEDVREEPAAAPD